LKRKFKGEDRGFSLIQVVIAVAIMGIAYIPVSSIFFASTRTIKGGSLKLSATLAAQTMIDELKHDMSIFKYKNRTFNIPTKPFPNLKLDPIFVKYYNGRASVSIKTDKNFPKRLREVTVDIIYEEYGNERKVTLSTLIANNKDIHYRFWK
jgi:type II secretory pathway pseudopilin PulG